MDIRVYDNVADEGLKILTDKDFTINQENEPDGIILRSRNIHDLSFNEKLVGIARAGTGVNNIPVEKASEQGIVVFNTPGANANAVSELVLASMVVVARNMIPANQWVNQLMKEDITEQVEEGKKQFIGSEIRGKTIGIIGLGSIGHLVANAAVELGMTVYGYDPFIKKEAAALLDRQILQVKEIELLYKQADFITIHVPSSTYNQQLIDVKALTLTKEEDVLMNFSRADVVDIEAVIQALDSQQLGYYVTDFPTPELMEREDCLLFPHLGASTEEAEKICAIMAAEQLTTFIETGNIRNAVNFPNVEMDFETQTRLAIVNRNIPNMINLLVDEIGKHEINIVHFINKSRGKYAYTLIDIDKNESELLKELLQNISANKNILSARLIKSDVNE